MPLVGKYRGLSGRGLLENHSVSSRASFLELPEDTNTLFLDVVDLAWTASQRERDLVATFERLKSLEQVDLSRISVSELMIEALAGLPKLRELRLERVSDLNDFFLRPLGMNDSLSTLHVTAMVDDVEIWTEAIARVPRLEYLDLRVIRQAEHSRSEVKLSESDVERIGRSLRGLRRMSSLKVLKLSDQFGDSAIDALGGVDGLASLESLDIARSRVTELGIAKLAERHGVEGVERTWLPRLRELHVDGFMVDDAGLAHIASLPGFQRLALIWGKLPERAIGLSNDGFKHLAKMPELEALALRGWSNINAMGFRHLALSPRLVDLTIDDCDGVDDDAVKAIAAMPHLRKCVLADYGRSIEVAGERRFEVLKAETLLSFADSSVEELRLPFTAPLRSHSYSERTLRALQIGPFSRRILTLDGRPLLQYARIALLNSDGQPSEGATVVILSEADGTVAALAREEVVRGLHLDEYMGPDVPTVSKEDRRTREKLVDEKTVYNSGILPVGKFRALAFVDGVEVADSGEFRVDAHQRTDVAMRLRPASGTLWNERHGGRPNFRFSTGPLRTLAQERTWKYWCDPPTDDLYRVTLRPFDAFGTYRTWAAVVCSAPEHGLAHCRTWSRAYFLSRSRDSLEAADNSIGVTFDRHPPPGTYFVRVFSVGRRPAVVEVKVTGDPEKDSVPAVLEIK